MTNFPCTVLERFLEDNIYTIITPKLNITKLINGELSDFKVIGYHYLDEKTQHEHTELHLHQIKYIDFSSYKLCYSHDNIIKITLINYKEIIVFNIEVDMYFLDRSLHNNIKKQAIEEEYMQFLQSRVSAAQSIYHNKVMELRGTPIKEIDRYDIILV